MCKPSAWSPDFVEGGYPIEASRLAGGETNRDFDLDRNL